MAVVSDSRIFRLACLAAALFVIVSLFWAGEKPIAVGLFPGEVDKVAHFAIFGLIAALMWCGRLRRLAGVMCHTG